MLKPPTCQGCPLQSISDSFSSPEGQGTSGVAIIGESLGYDEAVDGLPFRPHAAAGSKLEEIFRLAADRTSRPFSRNQFKLWNVLACRPPGNELVGAKYEQQAIEHCRHNFDNIFDYNNGNNDKFHARVLLALGNTPLKYLTGVTGIFEEKQSISHLRGYVFQSKYGLVVPSYHPAFLKRGNNHLTPLVVEDLIKAVDVARGTYDHYSLHSSYVPPSYQLTPSLDEAWSFYSKVKDSPKLVLSFDIETPESSNVDEDERDELANADITLVQFSIGKNTGIAFPYSGEYVTVIKALFGLPNIKANHNTYNFDNPRLQAKGIQINGIVHDTMWMFKHWHSQLPRGLQSVASMFDFPFPWKHLYKSNLNWYGCADVDAVQYIIHSLPRLMKQRGVWDGYMNHIVRLHPILERGSQHGIPVNESKRLETITQFTKIKKVLNQKLQRIIPDELRNIKPKRKSKDVPGQYDYGYVGEPKKVRDASEYYDNLLEKLAGRGIDVAGRIREGKLLSKQDFFAERYNLTFANFRADDGTLEEQIGVCDRLGEVDTGCKVESTVYQRWAVIEPFKGSSTQLIKYLRWKGKEITKAIEATITDRQKLYNGRNPELTAKIRELEELRESYKIPKDFKTKKETTGKKELEELYLKNGDPVLEMVMEIRSLDTNLNNFIPNWEPHSDGRVHTTFGYTAPQGQLDSRRPNILNCSKHTKYGNLFRGIVEAPSGYVFIEADKKSFHVGTMGYCANDPGYIKFSQTDPHSILGSYIDPSIISGSISLSWSEADILLAAKEFKKRCKQIKEKDPVHGIDVRQQMAKPTVLGNQLGLGAKKLQRQNRRFIKTVDEAERLQKIISNLFPKVELFKKHIKEKAYIEKFLINEFGMIQYFYDVFQFKFDKRNGTWIRKEGDGARAPIAFRVQGCAFGMIQLEMLEMERRGWCQEWNWVNSIHDSVFFMPRVEDKDKCIEGLREVMNMPCGKLVNESTGKEGLVVKVDVSVGRNWMGWDEEKNPEGMREI